MTAIAALFLGVLIVDLGLGDNGWGTLLGWAIWLVLVVLTLETICVLSDIHQDSGTFLIKIVQFQAFLHIFI